MKIHWYDGHEAGWTDDFGIVADKNTYLPYRPPGWYLTDHSSEIHRWCKSKLKSYQVFTDTFYPEYYIEDDKDVMLLKLRWPL